MPEIATSCDDRPTFSRLLRILFHCESDAKNCHPLWRPAYFFHATTYRFVLWGVIPKIATLLKDLPNFANLLIIVFYYGGWWPKWPPCGKTFQVLPGSYVSFLTVRVMPSIAILWEDLTTFSRLLRQSAYYCFSLWGVMPKIPPPSARTAFFFQAASYRFLLWRVCPTIITLGEDLPNCARQLHIVLHYGEWWWGSNGGGSDGGFILWGAVGKFGSLFPSYSMPSSKLHHPSTRKWNPLFPN